MRAARPKADVALTTGGSLRAELPAGPLTYGQLHEALPFDDRFATIAITGARAGRDDRPQPRARWRRRVAVGRARPAACVDGALQVTLPRPDGTAVARRRTADPGDQRIPGDRRRGILSDEVRAHAGRPPTAPRSVTRWPTCCGRAAGAARPRQPAPVRRCAPAARLSGPPPRHAADEPADRAFSRARGSAVIIEDRGSSMALAPEDGGAAARPDHDQGPVHRGGPVARRHLHPPAVRALLGRQPGDLGAAARRACRTAGGATRTSGSSRGWTSCGCRRRASRASRRSTASCRR